MRMNTHSKAYLSHVASAPILFYQMTRESNSLFVKRAAKEEDALALQGHAVGFMRPLIQARLNYKGDVMGEIKKRTIVLGAFLILLTGCKMPFEDAEKPREISIVVPPLIEEETEEVTEEVIEEVEEETEEIGDGHVEPLEVEMQDEALESPEEQYEEYIEPEYVEPYVEPHVSYGDHLTAWGGVYWYGDQKETWYNLPMEGVIGIMTAYGYSYDDYWIREDGCKMLGEYIMVAANLDVHPRGSLVMTSLGMGLVCDTGTFAYSNPLQVDIAVNW